MTGTEWLVVLAGVGAIAWVNWYFFLAERGVATAAVLWGPFGRAHLECTTPDHWLETPGDLLRLLKADG